MAIEDIDVSRELEATDTDYRQAAGSYAEYLLHARQRFERAEVVTVRQVREVYRRAARSVRDAVRTVTPGTLRERHLLALAKALEQQAEVMRGQLDSVLRSGIQLAVDIAIQPAEQITMEVLGDAFDRAGVRAMFTNVNQRAVTALLSRTRGDGLRLSDRIWRTSRTWQRAAARVIEDMVARGQNSREAARYIDRYLQPQTHTALKAETRRRLGVPKDVSMEAMRLAVTEMNNAFHEGTILAGRATPSYQGIHWRLSHSHVVPDICDRLAAGSPYRKGEEPTKPHPWCRCVAIQVHEDHQKFMQRLREWVKNPDSQPDLEKWYNDYARPFLSKPLSLSEGKGGSGRGQFTTGQPEPQETSFTRLAQEHGISRNTAFMVEKIGEDIRQRTIRHGVEYAAMVDMDSGEMLGEILGGQQSAVDISKHIRQMKPGKKYVQIHTHPRSSSFSAEDIMLLYRYDIGAMAVFGADGRKYIMSKVADVIENLWEIKEAYDNEVQALKQKYIDLIASGMMTEEEAWKEHTHEVWLNIAAKLGFKYSRLKE